MRGGGDERLIVVHSSDSGDRLKCAYAAISRSLSSFIIIHIIVRVFPDDCRVYLGGR